MSFSIMSFSTTELSVRLHLISFSQFLRCYGNGYFPLDRYASFERRAIKTLDLSHNNFEAANVERLVSWLKEAADQLQTLRLR